MIPRIVVALTLSAVLLASTSETRASAGGGAVVVDTILVRPVCLVATAVGSVFFVVALPFAAMSKSVKPTAHALVVKPAKAAITRPMGDFDSLTTD